MNQKFPLGQVVITRTAADALPQQEVLSALDRHATGDWGEVSDGDRQENELAFNRALRLFSVYTAEDGTRFWIITEADRSSTTVLLPEDY